MTTTDHATKLARGRQLLAAHHGVEAERLARDVLSGDPDSVGALQLLAASLIEQGLFDEGVRVAYAGLAYAPDDDPVRQTLCDGLIRAGRSQEARPVALRMVDDNPHSWHAHYTLGRAHLGQPGSHPSHALASAREAIRLAPWNPAPHNLAGICHLALHDRTQARSSYESALAIDPTYALAMSNLAALDVGGGNLRRGGTQMSRAIGLAPNSRLVQQQFARLVGRMAGWFFGVALVGLFLVFAATFQPWWVHATLATIVVAVLAMMSWRCLRVLPRGARNWWPVVWKHAPWGTRLIVVVGLLLTVALLAYGFAPSTSPPPVASGTTTGPGTGAPSGSPGGGDFPYAGLLFFAAVGIRVVWRQVRRRRPKDDIR
jgi:Flp pilus assembly protein TadD